MAMLGDFLAQHPMEEMDIHDAYHLFPSADNRQAWNGIPEEEKAQIRNLYLKYRDVPYPMRRATDFLAFVRSGSRKADEDPYFFRRRKLCAMVLQCCLEDDDAPLDEVIDGIWCICEESSWVISAHNVNAIPGAPSAEEYPLPDVRKPYIDLFSAQTAMILSFTISLLRKRLDAISPEIVERVRVEVRQRVLNPFMKTDDFWWMGIRRRDLNNWTPWIVSNIMYAACTVGMTRKRLAELLDRGCRMLDRWMAVMPGDGGCDEGAGYWNMAGGALLDCLELLERATRGRMTFWQDAKLRNILTFPLKADLGEGWFLNFADCDARPFLSGERLQYAGEKLNDPALTALGVRTRGTLADQLEDVPHFGRVLQMLFHPKTEQVETSLPGDVWLPDLQVRVVRRGGLTLCCKGGHNGENHNHNDVGSFMLYANGQPEIVDAGNMTYTAKTFSAERYTLWNTRSAYHNLPLIGETEQRAGREYAAREVHLLQDGLSLDIAEAYPEEAWIESLRREMRLTEEGFTLRDQIALRVAKPVTWVLMLRNPPEISRGQILTGSIRIQIPESLRSEVEEIPVTDPRMEKNFPGSLYRVLLTAPVARKHEINLKAAGR